MQVNRKLSFHIETLPGEHLLGGECVPSVTMRGFVIRVWRTDGSDAPIPQSDRLFISKHKWRKNETLHLRCDWHTPPTTYDLRVETMPTIFERSDSDQTL